ncbi:MAG: IspD/TarI family cytidylyltransferase [Spirochaetales bacterium]|nr:IspD/TarI family cytidylyltransferase [Spirochaetales bacterium]
MTSKNQSNHCSSFLITAAGSSSRMGDGIKKEFRLLNNKPVIVSVIETFLDSGLFDYGLITFKSGTEDELRSLLQALDKKIAKLKKPLIFCEGGTERQHSVRLGLQKLSTDIPELNNNGIVLIHDGARPWLTKELIRNVSEGVINHGACAPAIPSVDAMKELNENGIISRHLNRATTIGIQTPQGFTFKEILEAHNKAETDNVKYIDDTEIFSTYSGHVYTVPGDIKNKKITYNEDLNTQKEKGAET